MKSHARVVVIGGGIAGCSTLYHLTKKGWADVVLVEKAELTAGSTWHAAGNTPHYDLDPSLSRITKYSTELYARLEAETGQATSFKMCGSIRTAHTQDHLDQYRHMAGQSNALGVPLHMIGPNEIRAMFPFMEMEGILAAAHSPEDGYVDPSGAANALAKGARDGGAEIYRRTKVKGVDRLPAGEWRVTTDKGEITCEHVVNAGGSWARELGALSGLDLPVVPMENHYLVTETIPEVRDHEGMFPLLREPDASFYLRQERDGMLYGPYETKGAKHWGMDGIPGEFEMELLPPDLDRLQYIIEKTMLRVPVLQEVGIKRVVAGPIPHTPDGHPLIGPVAGAPGYWCNTGIIAGIAQSGGLGRQLAEWIAEGEPELDMASCDPRRYGGWVTKAHAIARTVEVYETMYSAHFPLEETPAGRPARTSPLYHALKARGAVFEARAGWERPAWFAPQGTEPVDRPSFRRANWFDAVGAECRAVADGVGVLDLSSLAKLEVSGAGAATCVGHLLANRLPAVGGIALSHGLTPKGKVACEFTVTRLAEDRFYLVATAIAEMHHLDWLERHLPAQGGVEVSNRTARHGVLLLAGPKSREVLAKLTEADLSNVAFPWMTGQEIVVGNAPVRAMRVNQVGELGWELHHAAEYGPGLYDALMAAGADLGIVDFGTRAQESMRLEKGYRLLGMDLGGEIDPLEAGLERFVALDDGDFAGRDALLAVRDAGPARRLAVLTVVATDADALAGAAVHHGGELVGAVTSGGYGHRVGASIAYASLPAALAEPDTALEVDILGDRRPATVATAPLYDPEGARTRA